MNSYKMNTSVMEQIAAPENLLAAWRSVRGNIPRYRRARAAGPDGVSLDDFERELSAQIGALRHQLLKGHYHPQPLTLFEVPKSDGSSRKVASLSISDRVAQRAAQQVIEPLWEPDFLPCSYGYRPGRSVNGAADRVRELRSMGNRWVVDGDISACFDNLDHAILLRLLEQRIPDVRVLDLLKGWLEQGIVSHGQPLRRDDWLLSRLEGLGGRIKQSVSHIQEEVGLGRYGLPDPNGRYVEEMDPSIYQADDQWERRLAMEQLSSGGLAIGMGLMRPLLRKAGPIALSTLRSAAGRVLIAQGAAVVVGAAGLAAGAYLIYQRFSPLPAGVLQGSPLSPLLANIYLHPFDRAVTRSRYNLVRFADDWVILAPNQEDSERAYNDAVRALARIRLKVNPSKTRILTPTDPLDWLGVRIP